jgi:hypothetical protein
MEKISEEEEKVSKTILEVEVNPEIAKLEINNEDQIQFHSIFLI